MKSAITPIVKDLVLVGGGHSHAIALKMLGMNPIPGLRLTLITDVYHTPYSGMLPGYVAGLYTYDECHIDLRPLSQFAQARLIVDKAIALDLEQNQVLCAHHPPISFDILSLDIGSTPATVTVPGAKEYAIPVKPISQFLSYWERLIQDIVPPHGASGAGAGITSGDQGLRLGIVGGGAGGVELALSVQARLERMKAQERYTLRAGKPTIPNKIHLFHRGPQLLPERHPRMRRRFQQMMVDRDIQLHLNDAVVSLSTDSSPISHEPAEITVTAKSGAVVKCDRVFWVTSASAAPWISQSGLATDDRGFLQVNDYLQSVSHPQVFAAGDIASMVNHPRPKAGVFAVRQGMPLYENLCRAVQHQPLKPFKPQKEFLILVGTGYERAIASRGSLSIGPSKLLWQWKDRIDRKFMDRFTDLAPMGENLKAEGRRQKAEGFSLSSQSSHQLPLRSPNHHQAPWDFPTPQRPNASSKNQKPKSKNQNPLPFAPCSGCASKVGKTVLDQVLKQFKNDESHALIGLDSVDDAAVLQIPTGKALVQTVDYFRALLDDPFLVGQITAHHCLNDLYAMGADPHSAMAIATLPYAIPRKQENTLYLLLSGVVSVLQEAGAELIGGHTTEGPELGLGLSCNGLVSPTQIWRKGGMQPGNQIILTKALGTGTLFAADMQLRAKGRWIDGAIASMVQSNQPAVACLGKYGATACTDVTGFGLAGHLLEMVTASKLNVALNLDAIEALPGAIASLEQGFFSSLYPENYKAETGIQGASELQSHPSYPLLFDPQTSGGLLVTIPAEQAAACLHELTTLGYRDSRIIGQTLTQCEQPTIMLSTSQ